jgi:hypothetical protein
MCSIGNKLLSFIDRIEVGSNISVWLLHRRVCLGIQLEEKQSKRWKEGGMKSHQ